MLRRWYLAKGLTKQVTVMRVEQSTGRVRYRGSRKRNGLWLTIEGSSRLTMAPPWPPSSLGT